MCGSPLEIARAMSDEELAGRARVAELPAAAGVEEAFRRRVSALPRDCGRALVVAAAGEALSVGQILAACALLDLRSEVLAPAQGKKLSLLQGRSHNDHYRALISGAN
jgi:hypothetical protein